MQALFYIKNNASANHGTFVNLLIELYVLLPLFLLRNRKRAARSPYPYLPTIFTTALPTMAPSLTPPFLRPV